MAQGENFDTAGWAAAAACWSCACCLPPEFDLFGLTDEVPPPPRRRFPRRFHRGSRAFGLWAESCSAVAHAARVPGGQKGRNVIPQGQQRFDLGLPPPEQPDWEPLSDRVVSVLGQNPSKFTLNGTNCYLVGSGPRRLLIDAADEHHGSENFLEGLGRCMEEHGIEGLSGILVTHMHHDHFGNIRLLQEKYGPVPVYSHGVDDYGFDLLNGLRDRGLEQYFLTPQGRPYVVKMGGTPASQGIPDIPADTDFSWAEELVHHIPGKTTIEKARFLHFFQWHRAWLKDMLLSGAYDWHQVSDGDVIATEGATLTAMHTPGHAPDHVAFLLEEEHALFSGDNVLGWGTTLVFDMRDYMEALQRMLALKPTRLYPGHGSYIEDGVDMLVRYIDHRKQREHQAWDVLQGKAQPVPLADIVRELYPETRPERIWMAKDNLEKLLRKFALDGAARAWRPVGDGNGGQQLVPYAIPQSGYKVTRLPGDLLWGARRSMVRFRELDGDARRAKL